MALKSYPLPPITAMRLLPVVLSTGLSKGMLNGLDLFSGIGGIAQALSPWVKPVAYCEIEPYAQQVLAYRMADGLLPVAPIWDDVTTLTASELSSPVDIITGGFPCQDISVAGYGAGLAGKRSGLFYEVTRLASELRPSFIFLENVPAITGRGGTAVVAELTKGGYECRWTTLSARAIGANHKRERWWLLARRIDTNTRCQREGGDQVLRPQGQVTELQDVTNLRKGFPYTNGERLETVWQCERLQSQHASTYSPCWWGTEPAVGRVAYGVSNRVDRIKGLGNAVVPLQARVVFYYLLTGSLLH
jgi:DNA (cytosine-5)-methyltransferase 1